MRTPPAGAMPMPTPETDVVAARPTVALAAASGIGDAVRATPLVVALHRLGWAVDVVLLADYAGTAAIIEGAPEVRRVLEVPNARAAAGPLAGEPWDLAVVSPLARRLARRLPAHRTMTVDPARWKRDGDAACWADVAHRLGWKGAMPRPFIRGSDRRFAIEPGTVALHPGCKPGWPWKRWHGFPALAAALPRVVVVGTDDDRDAAGAYFGRMDPWPAHVRDFTGQLPLPDTVALLGQCAALVANDSGLLHVAAALGIPAVGVFGLTSPARELMPLPNAHAVTGGLACEPACRRRPWGRRDCHRHLECLRTLEPERVLARLAEVVEPEAFAAVRACGPHGPATRRAAARSPARLHVAGG